jgi:hypothetical protein
VLTGHTLRQCDVGQLTLESNSLGSGERCSLGSKRNPSPAIILDSPPLWFRCHSLARHP